MGRTETDRQITNEPRSSMRRGQNRTTKTTLWSERSSALKKGLTGPTLLEMSGYRCQDLTQRKSLLVWIAGLRYDGCGAFEEVEIALKRLVQTTPEGIDQLSLGIAARGMSCCWEKQKAGTRTWNGCVRASRLAIFVRDLADEHPTRKGSRHATREIERAVAEC